MKRLHFMRSFLALLAAFGIVHGATAQTLTDPNEGSRLTFDSQLGAYDFSWWGKAGRTYFIQQSDDLFVWEYLTIVESGTDDVLSWGFTSTAGEFFLRLRYSDIATTNPFYDDFDGDKVGNYDELWLGTDPLVSVDSDGDSLPDDWERWHFGSLAYGANDDPDGDGLSNAAEFQHNTNPNNADSDYDGLSDGDEVNVYHTDPLWWDTDQDGMTDGWETQHGFAPLLNDAAGDADGDGLTNLEEYWYSCDPHATDTDGDGISDGLEIHMYFTYPTITDSDSDGLGDGAEVNVYFTDPLAWDTDGDGLRDGDEALIYFTNPLLPDTDGDGLPDKWEVDNQLNPLVNDSALDADMDGLTNGQEFLHQTDPQDPDSDGDDLGDGNEVNVRGTDPLNFDSDFDGLPDGWEIQYGMNPLVADNASADPDSDGLTNAQEAMLGTNPNAADTDGDGTGDAPESAQGSNPKNAADGGQPPPPDTLVTLKLWLGAEQTASGEPGSYHEDDFQAYRMKIYEKNPNGSVQSQPLIDYPSNGTFVNGPTEFKFQKTKSYVVKVFTAAPGAAGAPNKDFDYTALITGCVVTDDPDGILGDHEQDQQNGAPFPQRGKKATLTIPKIEFKPLNPSSGFDDTTNPHWLMAPENGSNYAKAEITPASVANKINFVIRPDASQEIVTPATATASPQTVTVNGMEKGEGSWVEARCEGQTEACAKFNIVVKGYKLYTIDYHLITEQNDDVQTATHGAPDDVAIFAGFNGFLDSIRGGDDQIVNNSITFGANGINESTVKNTNLVPQATPSAADVQSKLNGIYGLQTNTYFFVHSHDHTLNYDLDRSGKLTVSPTGTPSDEQTFIVNGTNNTNFDFHLYHVMDFLNPLEPLWIGFAPQDSNYAFMKDFSNLEYVAAHEIGHLFKLPHADQANPHYIPDPDMATRVMRHNVAGTTASRLIKYEWDIVSPTESPQ